MRHATPPLAEIERRHILMTLRICDGNRTHAAKLLNISLRCLRNKLRDYKAKGNQVPETTAGHPAHLSSNDPRYRDLLGVHLV